MPILFPPPEAGPVGLSDRFALVSPHCFWAARCPFSPGSLSSFTIRGGLLFFSTPTHVELLDWPTRATPCVSWSSPVRVSEVLRSPLQLRLTSPLFFLALVPAEGFPVPVALRFTSLLFLCVVRRQHPLPEMMWLHANRSCCHRHRFFLGQEAHRTGHPS